MIRKAKGAITVIGIIAILSLAGAFSFLPREAGFFVVVLSAILFPGIVISRLLLEEKRRHCPSLKS